MQAMLMIYSDEAAWNAMPPAEQGRHMAAYKAFSEALVAAGAMRGGERLQPVATAATVQVKHGKATVLDGPYAETKEQLGGYFIIEVPDMDAAIHWASRCPGAEHGRMEVRPIWQMATVPA